MYETRIITAENSEKCLYFVTGYEISIQRNMNMQPSYPMVYPKAQNQR